MADALFPHQRIASGFLAANRRALYWGDPGIGKTAAAIAASGRAGCQRILVLAPLSTLVHWQREFWQWGRRPAHIVRKADDIEFGHVYIVNPERLYNKPLMQRLLAEQWDCLILDECQAYKNPDAKRTKLVYGKNGLVHRTGRCWLMSGTPCPQGPVDLFVPLRVLWPEVVAGMSRDSYIDYYHVLAEDKIKILGGRNLDDLTAKMAPFTLRQAMDECHLPPLLIGTYPLAPDDLIFDDFDLNRATAAAKLDGWDRLDEADMMDLVMENSLALSTVRALLSSAKAPRIAEIAVEEFEDGLDKLVIFSWHLAALHKLRTILDYYQPGLITGAIGPAQRQADIDRFQTDPDCRVILVQGDAGGLGITLTAASQCWFVDCPWTASQAVQAVKRLHRMGHKRPVLARLFCVAGTIDDAVAGVIRRKARMIVELQPSVPERVFS